MKINTTVIAMIICLLVSLCSAQTTLYREIFAKGPKTESSGWHYHAGSNARDVGKAENAWGGGPGSARLPEVNSDAQPVKKTKRIVGFIYLLGHHQSPYLFWTDEYQPTEPIGEMRWHMALKDANVKVRVAVQIDVNADGRDGSDPWFVSDTTFSDPKASKKIDKVAQTTFSLRGAKWKSLEFEPGTMLRMGQGEARVLPGGRIVAFGVFGDGRAGQSKVFDTFELHRQVAPPPVATRKAEDTPPVAPTLVPMTDKYSFRNVNIGGGGYFTGVFYSPAKPGLMYTQSDMCGPYKREGYDQPWYPTMLNEWQPRPIGRCVGVGMHPTNPDIVYAMVGGRGDFPRGLFKTTDGGEHWKQVSKFHMSGGKVRGARFWGNCIAVDPNKPDVVYVAARDLQHSMDGGAPWKVVLPREKGHMWPGSRSVLVDGGEKMLGGRSKIVYVSVHSKGVAQSTDGGDSFKLMPSFNALPGGPTYVRWFTIGADRVVYAAHQRGLAKLTPGGQWQDITAPDMHSVKGVSAHPRDAGRLVAIGSVKGKGSAIFRSLDDGKTWLPTGIAGKKQGAYINAWTKGWYYHRGGLAPTGIFLDPHNDGHATLVNAFQVRHATNLWDENVEWHMSVDGAENTVALHLSCPPASDDGRSAPLVSGFADIRGFVHHDPNVIPNKHIRPKTGRDNVINTIGSDYCETQPNVLWATRFAYHRGTNGHIIKSTDAGNTWRKVGPNFEQEQGGMKIAVSATDPNNVVVMPGRPKPVAHYTKDGGKTWQHCRTSTGGPLPPKFMHTGVFNFANVIAADRVAGGTFYAYRAADHTMWVSRDGGATWTPTVILPSKNPHDDLSGVHVVTAPGRAGEVWINLANAGIYRSADFGQSFQRVPYFQGHRPTFVTFGKEAPGNAKDQPTIYVWGKAVGDAEQGLYRSTDMGTTWSKVDRKLHRGIRPRIFAADRQEFGRVYFSNIFVSGVYQGYIVK